MMIEIENLTKSFGKTKALDGFSLKIEDNEIYGFVGQNGAGKTTTMRIISGLIPADSGKVIINGLDAGCEVEKVRSKIGYVPDFFGVYDNLKVIEYIEFFAAAYNMTGRETERECLRLLEELGLSDKTDFFVDDLSRGQKQRLGLARALIHNPDILVLDEPTSGMDPKGRVETRNLLKRLNAQGRTILISSHILHEISELVTGLAIIEKGKVVMSGSIDSIERTMHIENPIIMKVNKGANIAAEVLKEDEAVLNLTITEADEFYISYSGSEEDEGYLLKRMVEAGVLVSSFSRRGHDLESVFIKIME
jgi:hypothetical protein